MPLAFVYLFTITFLNSSGHICEPTHLLQRPGGVRRCDVIAPWHHFEEGVPGGTQSHRVRLRGDGGGSTRSLLERHRVRFRGDVGGSECVNTDDLLSPRLSEDRLELLLRPGRAQLTWR